MTSRRHSLCPQPRERCLLRAETSFLSPLPIVKGLANGLKPGADGEASQASQSVDGVLFGLGFEIWSSRAAQVGLELPISHLSFLSVGITDMGHHTQQDHIYKLEKHFTCTKMCTGKKRKMGILGTLFF